MVALLLWTAVYLGLVIGPLAVLALGLPPRGGFAWDLSLAFGYLGLGMAGAQLWLTARFPRIAAPFGIDILYRLHRDLAAIALALLLAHAAILLARFPEAVGTLDPLVAPPHLTAGVVALAAFTLLVASSILRKRFALEYDRWRHAHAVLAALGLAAATWHVHAAGSWLGAPLARALWTALPLAWLALIVWVRVLRPWRLARRPYRVVEVRREPGDAVTLALEPARAGGPALAYAPGQFAWLTLGASPWAMREHPFSFTSTPTRPGRLEFTIKALGDFTRGVAATPRGATAFVDGPYGSFGVERLGAAPGLCFIAGGVGIAPMISVLRALADRGDRRPLVLFYGNRRWERALFRDELAALASRLALTVVPTVEEPTADWTAERGFVDRTMLERHLPPDRARWHHLLCGPTPMMRAAERDLADLGVPLTHIHGEIFDLA
jgi:predicted ferric reductase